MLMTRRDSRQAACRFIGVLGLVATGITACAQGPGNAIVPPAESKSAWMELHRSFVERGKKETVAKEGPVDLLFLGDSITQGWHNNDVWKRSYGARNAANFGIGGDRTQHVLWRIQNGELEGIEPKVTVLMIGTNNASSATPDEIAQGITAITKELHRRLPKTRILLLGIFPEIEKPSAARDELQSPSTTRSPSSMTARGSASSTSKKRFSTRTGRFLPRSCRTTFI